MSTSTDAPPTASGPPDGPEDSADGANWLQREMQRRMAAKASGGGGRHARRDTAEPPRGVDYVPRHSIATPGPGTDRPAPIGGPALPATLVPPPGPGWSGPERPAHDTPPPPGVRARTAAATAPPAAARPSPTAPSPAAPSPVAPSPTAPPSPAAARPSPASTPRPPAPRPPSSGPRTPVAPPPADRDSDQEVGGPSRSTRPVPRAFRRTGRGQPTNEPAVFGGPAFAEPAPRQHHEPQEPDAFGGEGFYLPATRPDLDDLDEPPRRLDADVLGLDLPERVGPVTVATGPASDVVPPRAPARLLAPPAETDVETTVRIDPVVDDEDEDDEDDLAGADDDEGEVLWSRDDLPDDDDPEGFGSRGNRRLVVISEKKTRARAVRTVDSIQEGGPVGELLRSDLIRSQLRVALRFAVAAGLLLGLLPLAFALFPAIGRAELLGIRLPWIVLGFAVYPLLFGLGWLHTRTAERVEHEFAERVQD